MSSSGQGSAEAAMRDIRKTQRWAEVHDHFSNLYAPAFGKVSHAADLDVSPDGHSIAFTGTVWQSLEKTPETRICLVDISAGEVKTITEAPNDDKLPKWSADGQRLAFLSDRVEKGNDQVYVAKLEEIAEAKPVSSLDTIAEYLHWSPDGTRVLIGMAGRGAEKGAASGSGTFTNTEDVPEWMPEVQSGDVSNSWRTICVYDTADGSLRQVSRSGSNVWEATWCGNDRAIAIVSDQPSEESWYTAKLVMVDIGTGSESVLYSSPRQLGLPTASPSGKYVAVVQAVCSDRGIVAGDILLIDPTSSQAQTPVVLAIGETDATHLVWRNDEQLFYAGQRGLQTVAGDISIHTKGVEELWVTSETCGSWYPAAQPITGGLVSVCESWTRYPEIAQVIAGKYHTIASLDHGGGEWLQSKLGPIEEVKWKAPDGIEIEGLLYLPKSDAKPYPLVLDVHGGPVWAHRNWWLGRSQYVALLVSRGYAVLGPNPRGSGGRGQAFAEKVYGDMGGADTQDYLSGLDMLVDQGIADPSRLGVTGGSYGGFMTSWIVTQTDRFTAAVAVAPVTDWLSQHTTSNIPHFDSIFLDRQPYAANGLYFSRSPVRFAGRYPTPVLLTAGAVDRCTPPTQALQYHQALLEHGVASVLVTYPKEGHGVRNFPAHIDLCVRLLGWFEAYVPVERSSK